MSKFSIQLFILLTILTVLLSGCSEDEWTESDIFVSGSFKMLGEEGQLGFIYDGGEITKFYPNKVNKYMWHFWGSEEDLEGDLKVVGTHNESEIEINVLEDLPLIVMELNGADASTPSLMSLPKSGMWKLDAFVDDRLHGSVYVKVH
ncbi:hypothetical protein [Aquibacillus rhizosphaerae]|uniref:DUF4871 domain-containing protein n=1 Tax=Aquibacillus rhizosphaerae TaxID=3051431 RepID=A0ABT7L4U7_9BACI|nr:hypothetical protein [Aquibacillus sp. LR5S19]MDL4840215.1 hypothetical protein [Aquibacillus sp. LR5S19]